MESYRNQSGPPGPCIVDFRTLRPLSQERFTRATLGQEPTGVLLAAQHRALGTSGQWLLLAALGLAALAGAGASEFGSLRESSSAHVVFYVLGSFLSLFGMVMAARASLVRGGLPFLPGVYVFPGDLVDARTAEIKVRPLDGLVQVSGPHGEGSRATLALHFADSTYQLPAGSWTASELSREIETLRLVSARARDRDDRASLAWLDPLGTGRSAWQARHAEPEPEPVRWAWAERFLAPAVALTCLTLAVPIGGASLWVRDIVSDSLGVQSAVEERSDRRLDAYVRARGPLAAQADAARLALARERRSQVDVEYYLQSGGRNTRAADDLLFSWAVESGSRRALEHYLEKGTEHRDEARALLANR